MIVVGEALVDLVEEEDGRYDPRLGGSARNVALALARLGTDVEWCWGLGDDVFGTRFREEFDREGVGTSHAVDVEAPTPLAVVSVDADGSPSYGFHLAATAATGVPASALTALPADEPVHVSLGAVTLATPGVGDQLQDLLARRGERSTLTTLDPNLRPAFLGDPGRQRELLATAASSCAIVRCSDEDLELLTSDGSVTPDDVVAQWLARGAAAVVVTRGGRGATVTTGGTEVDVSAPRAEVVDTVGAGDTFGAGMLTALLERDVRSRADVVHLDEDGWREVLGFAAAAATVTVGRRGADPPHRSELA